MSVPKVFISYSHDTQEHKKWVLELAIRLRNNGIDAILDQFELKPGDDVPHFMETNLASSDKIIMVCTERYVEKANAGHGGVGYEKMIITSNLMTHIDGNKIIPIVRQNLTISVPTFLKSKLYINFNKADDYEYSYDDLVRVIHNSPLFVKPPVGNNPFKEVSKKELDGDIELMHTVFRQVVKNYEVSGSSSNKGTLSRQLDISRILIDIALMKLIGLGYIKRSLNTGNMILTDEGKFYAIEKGFVK